MKKKKIIKIVIFLILLIVVLLLILKSINTKFIVDRDTVSNYEDSDFSIKFLKMENNGENMVYSPLSIKYALKMLYEGADGNTKTQIESLIGNTSLTQYTDIEDVLSIANSMYIRDKYADYIKENYTNILSQNYNAEIIYDSFESADEINSWISNKTFGLINNILDDKIVQDANSVAFLINALAIDMSWETTFDSEDTGGGTFYLEDGSEMEATMLKMDETYSENISYYYDSSITALEMDLKEYEDTKLGFIAIVPEKDNLSDFIDYITYDDIKEVINSLTLASDTKFGLDITIPRFSIEYELDLKNDLKKLGLTDMFDDDLADFSNMLSNQVWIKDTIHQANIDFTESGIRASATTVVWTTMGASLLNSGIIEINIDKPFIYLIFDKETNEIWFTGAVYEPNSWAEDKETYVEGTFDLDF